MRPRQLPSAMEALLAPRAPVVRTSISGTALVILLAVFLGILLYYAQFSGSLQWILGLAFLAILAAFAWSQVRQGTSEPAPLVPAAPQTAYRPGELDVFAASVDRAARGLPYSQVLVSSRARAAFLEHARLALGLAPEAMREMQRDPAALRRVFGDNVLVDFLRLRVGDLEERYGWVLRARHRRGFRQEFGDVLARMEAWR